MAFGMHERSAVACIWGVQIVFSFIGMSFWIAGVPEWVMLAAFVATFAGYTVVAEMAWRRIEYREQELERKQADEAMAVEGARRAA
jgi:L-asparagine transporter-like permease